MQIQPYLFFEGRAEVVPELYRSALGAEVTMKTLSCLPAVAALVVAAGAASAAPLNYKIEPAHTYPSFEADHMGISVWRGKFNKSSGKVMLDKGGGAGTVDVAIDLASIDFGNEPLNRWARGKDFFDTRKHPKATYKGRLDGFTHGVPSQAVGDLTLHGVTRPVVLKILAFKCIPHPLFKRDLCGADALASIKRDEFGLDAGKAYGFSMDVTLRIQVEAIQGE